MKILRPMTVNDAALTSSTVAETDYAAYSSGTTYALGARVIVVSANVHKIYESLQASNLNHAPASSPTWWLDIGSTNRWRMFDQGVATQTVNLNSIDVTLKATGRVNGLVLLNIAAASVQVIVTDAVEGEVYNRTISLISTAGINNWYSYFFEPVVRYADQVVLDMPAYYAPTVRVILSAPGETVKAGALLLGLQVDVGGTQYGAGVGIQDYSVKTQNAFGDYTILERAFRKRASFTVWVEAGKVDQLHSLLAEFRATPTVYIGSDLYAAMIVYGFYKDFNIAIAYARESICTIELEGLT